MAARATRLEDCHRVGAAGGCSGEQHAKVAAAEDLRGVGTTRHADSARRVTRPQSCAGGSRACSAPPRRSSSATSAPSLAAAPSVQIHAATAAEPRSTAAALPSSAASAHADAAVASAALNASPAAAVSAPAARPAGLAATTRGARASPLPNGASRRAHCAAERPPRTLAADSSGTPQSAPTAMWLHCVGIAAHETTTMGRAATRSLRTRRRRRKCDARTHLV